MNNAGTPSLTVFFPCYNEEENVEALAVEVDRVVGEIADDYEVIIVDDGSTDRTGGIADRIARERPHVRVIHHPRNLGYGTALRTGFAGARKELVLYTDGDCQFDIRDLRKLLPLMREGVDLVVGYRENRQDRPLRKIVSRVYNAIIRLIFGLRVRDIDCAFKLFRRSVFDKVEIRSERFLVDTEILVQAKRAGLTIVETPVTHLPRTRGASSVSPRDVFRTLRELSHLWLHIFMVNWKKLILSSLVSLGFIGLFVRHLDYRLFTREIGRADKGLILLGLAAYGLSFWFRSVRWKLLLLPEGRFRIGALFSGIVIGFMANNVLPVRMGELVRAYDFGRRQRVSKSLCFATVVVDRMMDGLTLIACLAAILMFASFQPIVNRIFVLGLLTFFSLFIVLFYLVAGKSPGRETGIYRAVDNLGRRYLKTEGQFVISNFIRGLEALLQERLMLAAFGVSLLVWFAEAGMYACFIRAFDLVLPAWAPLFVLCIVNLGLIVPSIGYVGTFEWFCKAALLQFAAYAVDPARAAGYSLALHATQYIPVTLLGIVFFIRHNFDVVRSRDELRITELGD